MATKTYLVEKLKPGPKVLPCQGRKCDIATNKRYRSPAGRVYVACMFEHAEDVYRRCKQKAVARAAA